jgi:hypothetical protein
VKALAGAISLIFLGSPAVASYPTPTKTGDPIGSVTMNADGSLVMDLSSVQCDGMIAEGRINVRPADSNYQEILNHVGGLKPSETKVVLAWPTPACASK